MLISLDEYKTATGVSGVEQDDRLTQAIEWASAAIQNEAERAFEDEGLDTRQYTYYGDGFLEIDDARLITAVRLDGTALTATAWTAEPLGKAVYTWLELDALPHGSPEMGFTRNLDRWQPSGPRKAVVEVDATFGWAEVPGDVKQAVVWTVASFASNPNAYISEAIAGYSRTIANPAARVNIPDRAQRALEPYTRRSF